ncbi:hypothetical protein NCTGTJJY_CDS0030 [Serratia phage 92A1]|nr:hypothetical protein NCTGTJJY_CDS0030 [Serratia phage 92A1]
MITGAIHPIFVTKWFALIDSANDSDKGMCNCTRNPVTLEHSKDCCRHPNPVRQSRTKP